MMESNYTITVTAQQAHIISRACELMARLGIGQFRDALEELPLAEWPPAGWHEDMAAVSAILKKHTRGHVDGWSSSLSIGGATTPERAQVAWDLCQVIRHRLAWDRAIASGVIRDGDPRRWPEMMGVDYDNPSRTGDEPLARIERVTPPPTDAAK